MSKPLKIILSFFLFIILLPFAFSDYTQHYYNKGTTEATNLDLPDPFSETSAILTKSWSIPLVEDLDNDGKREIVVIDGSNQVKFYQNIFGKLTLAKVYVDGTGWGNIQQSELVDIDSDGLTEVVFTSDTDIYIVEYNGSHATLENKINFNPSALDVVFGCQFANRCVLVYNTRRDLTGLYTSVRARAFSKTGFNGGATVLDAVTGGATEYAYCTPQLRAGYWADVWDDGEQRFVTTWARYRQQNDKDNILVFIIHLNATNQIDNFTRVEWNRIGNAISGWDNRQLYNGLNTGTCQSADAGRKFSPAVPVEMSTAYNGLELVYSIMTSNDLNYIIDVKSSNTLSPANVERFPALQNQEGRLIGNTHIASIFPDGDGLEDGGKDVCVMGYNEPDNVIKYLCGRGLPTIDEQNVREFYIDLDDYAGYNWDISYGEYNYFRSAHSTQATFQNIEDNDGTFDPTEILTPYGVLAIDPDSWDNDPLITPKDGDLYPLLTFVNEEGVLISAKTKTVPISDFIYLANQSITLLDNGLVNEPAWISEVLIDPCLEDDEGIPNAWKQGTDAQISVTVQDNDADLVRSRVILYFGEGNITGLDYEAYNSDDDPQTDGVYEGDEEGIGSDGGGLAYDMSFLLRNVSTDSDLKAMTIRVGGVNGNPETNNFDFDLFICPTNVNSLTTATADIFSNCVEPRTLLKANINLSSLFGTGSTLATITFSDNYETLPAYNKYIVGFEYRGGTLDNDNWKIKTDNNPTNSLIKVHRYTYATNVTDSTVAVPEIAEITLISANETQIERDSNWSSYYTPGNSRQFTFSDVDYITPLSKIKIMVNDFENSEDIEERFYNFFVQSSGVVLGECISAFNYSDPSETPVLGDSCNVTEDCTGAQVCINGNCAEPDLTYLADVLLPPDSVPVAYRPIIGLIAIIILVVGAVVTLNYYGIADGRVLLSAGILVTISLWLVLIQMGILAGWTLLVALVLGGAVFGFLFWSKHKGG